MPREFSRKVRVAEGIRRALAPMISDWTRENAAGMGSITDVDVSPDLKSCRVLVSLYRCEDVPDALKRLNEQAPRLRHALGQELRLRSLPALRFEHDDSIEQGDRITRMLAGLNSDTPTHE